MKLRNKKTGEIIDTIWWDTEVDKLCIDGDHMNFYGSLAEINDEWEDYEDPKGWYIDISFTVKPIEPFFGNKYTKILKQCGNYFGTKEEAEKAVEKLKAWKRLKDKGFRFIGKTYETDKRFGSVFYELNKDTYSEDIIDALDLLFGGEDA